MNDKAYYKELVDLTLALAGENKVENLMLRVVEAAKGLAHAEGAAIYTLDRLARNLHPVCYSFLGTVEGRQSEERIALYDKSMTPNMSDPAVFAVTTGTVVNIADVDHAPGYDFSKIGEMNAAIGVTTRSIALFPLRVQKDRTIGLLQLMNMRDEDRGQFGGLPEPLIAPLQSFAAHAAIAIWNARLFEENLRLKKQLHLQNEELLQQKSRTLSQITRKNVKPEGLVGDSPPIEKAVKLIARAAVSTVPILVRGETGTGKEMMAGFIHKASDRADNAFVVQNCAALPETLLESELFGYVKGAFTGAGANKQGLAHEAHKGTLFLDEIGDMPLSLQAKVLRLLQEGEVRRVGSTRTEKVDVRIVAATNVDLEAKIEQGEFRKDLYYRLNVFPIIVPPLRERPSDIPRLIEHFLRMAAQNIGRPVPEVTPEAFDALMCWSYPGNVRELKNILDRAALLVDDGQPIDRRHLPLELGGIDEKQNSTVPSIIPEGDLKSIVGQYEALVLEAKLREVNWNKSHAARNLNVSRRTIVEKINRYDLKRPKSAKRSNLESN